MKRIVNKLKRTIAINTNKKLIDINLKQPIVSFTFDDFPFSAYQVGGKILDDAGYKATYFVALDLMNKEDETGKFFSDEQLLQAKNSRNEIACHSFGHLHYYSVSPDEVASDINKWLEKINEYFPDLKLRNFSYPFGEITPESKKIIMQNFVSARGSEFGINYASTDIYHLKSVGIYNKHLSKERVDKIFTKAKNNNAWIMFYTHDIQSNYSDFGCAPDLFEYVVKKCIKEKLDVKTVDEVIKIILK